MWKREPFEFKEIVGIQPIYTMACFLVPKWDTKSQSPSLRLDVVEIIRKRSYLMKIVERIRKTTSSSQKITLNTIFRDEDGAIDLASIMVGVIVIGLIGGTIAATVFAVIPWSQDNAAKQQLDSIVQAENAYFGLSAANPSPLPAGTPANSFGKSAELANAKLLITGERYCATTSEDKKSYTGYSQSGSGKVWTVTDKNSKAVPFTESIDLLPADCKFITEGMTPANDSNPIPTGTPTPTPTGPYVDPTPTKTILTYKCDTTVTEARIPIDNATGTETWSDGMTHFVNSMVPPFVRQLDAGVEYKVVFDGTYNTFNAELNAATKAASSCLRSVDHWGSASGVTQANYAFSGATNLTNVPDHIPTSIRYMSYMFKNATSFNDPSISNWNVGNVYSMIYMFYGATSFNQPLDDWDVSKVIPMSSMFNGATSFNQPLNSWDTSSVTEMDQMFYGASNFDQPLNDWDTSNVTNMHMTFFNSPVRQDFSSWDMEKVTKLAFMFTSSEIYDIANPQRVVTPTMTKLTYKCDTTVTGGKLPLVYGNGYETWNDGIGKVVNGGTGFMSKTLQAGIEYTAVFEGTYSNFNADYDNSTRALTPCLRRVDGWGDAVGVTSVAKAFFNATNLTKVPANLPSTVYTTNNMFNGATNFNDPNISNWNTVKVGDMNYMFNGATNFNQPLNDWNTANVMYMDHMFYGASNFNQPLNNWNTAKVTNMHLMFWNTQMNQELSSWDMSKVTRMANMLPNSDSYTTAKLQKTTHPAMLIMTYKCDVRTNVKAPIDNYNGFETWNDGTTKAANSGSGSGTKMLEAGVEYTYVFEGTYSSMNSNSSSSTKVGAPCIRSVDFWGDGTQTYNYTNAFAGATNLTDVPDNIPSYGNSLYMAYMFNGATNFNDPSVTKWDTTKLARTAYMFQNATSFNQNISSWNTAKVYEMSYMFAGATSFNQNLSGWDTTTLTTTNGVKFAPSTFNINYLPPKTSL
jgi:surface protein